MIARNEPTLGAILVEGGVEFAVWSSAAERIWVSLFDGERREYDRIELARGEDGVHSRFVAGLGAGARYGIRADGPYDPAKGLWFDPTKLLTDPYALEIEWPYHYNALLAAPRWQQFDTAPIIPKTLVQNAWRPLTLEAPRFSAGGLIYELSVRSFSMRHPEVPQTMRGTVAALAHPAIIEHLKRIGVAAVELMPITASMDERHLQSLGLTNAWRYNPVTFMALDQRLVPGGWGELRETVAALHSAGIGVILDLVFNHTAESDEFGPTLSLRGLDSAAYYRHHADGTLVNDTGTGNTINCDHPVMRRMVLDALRTFIERAGIDGFRFDLATILGRRDHGFDPEAPLFRAMIDDPLIGSRILIAEPWDIGPGGYQLGAFPQSFLEWNDRYRDDIRRFWRGDAGMIGSLATRLAGSSDVFARSASLVSRTVNFIAAHDGMSIADLVTYRDKHNAANGEDNRDGHDGNLSWNNGVEGPSEDAHVVAMRRNDLRALLATLFVSRGTIMLTAGDEFGRTQGGNNNAYAQDNAITWLDWEARDRDLEEFVANLSELRTRLPVLANPAFLDPASTNWLRPDGLAMAVEDWENPETRAMVLMIVGDVGHAGHSVAIAINGTVERVVFAVEEGWSVELSSGGCAEADDGSFELAPRSIAILIPDDQSSTTGTSP